MGFISFEVTSSPQPFKPPAQPETIIKINKLTSKQIKISKEVAILLKKKNIFFAGVDFVQGQLIGDINVTSPTGLATYYHLTGVNLAKFFWDSI